ncbi:MAG TPA: hypothetical protein VI299_06710, partial [Polyangiales bacterium]
MRCLRIARLEALAACLCLWFSWSSASQADSAQGTLDMSACSEIDASEVRRILSLELSVSDASSDDTREVRVECDRATARLSSRDRTRTLALESVPEPLRARLLALAIAELGPRASGVAAEPSGAPPAERPPSVAPVRPRAPQRSQLWLGAYGQRGSAWAAGATLGFTSSLRRMWAWSSGAAFTQGTHAIDRGQLRVRHASLYAGPALQLAFA